MYADYDYGFDCEIRAMLQKLTSPQLIVPEYNYYVGILYKINCRVIEEFDQLSDSDAEMIQAAYDNVVARTKESGEFNRRNEALSRIEFSVRLIARFGSREKPKLLNLENTIEFALSQMPLTLEEEKQKLPIWWTLSKDEMRKLVRARNLCTPFRDLPSACHETLQASGMKEWLDLDLRLHAP